MSKDKILKKAAFGGFKKEDVIDYIEKLQQEMVDLKREASDCAAYKREADALRVQNAENEKTIASLQAENDGLKAENSSLTEKNAAITLRLEQLTSVAEKNREDAAEAERKYEALNAEFLKITDINAIAEEARASVSKIASDAKSAVSSARADISAAADRFKTVSVNFESSLVSLKSGTDALLDALSTAAEKIDAVDAKDE